MAGAPSVRKNRLQCAVDVEQHILVGPAELQIASRKPKPLARCRSELGRYLGELDTPREWNALASKEVSGDAIENVTSVAGFCEANRRENGVGRFDLSSIRSMTLRQPTLFREKPRPVLVQDKEVDREELPISLRL